MAKARAVGSLPRAAVWAQRCEPLSALASRGPKRPRFVPVSGGLMKGGSVCDLAWRVFRTLGGGAIGRVGGSVAPHGHTQQAVWP